MDAVQVMKDEHTYIKRMLKVLRKACLDILEGKPVDFELFEYAVDFIKNYADKYHHSKEEDVLFKIMKDELAEHKDTVSAVQGMFIEHDFGRLFIFNLLKALERVRNGENEARLDIIGNAIPYTDLLTRHIDKEDNALFDFGVKALKDNTIEEVNRLSHAIDIRPENQEQIRKYTDLVGQLEKRVGF